MEEAVVLLSPTQSISAVLSKQGTLHFAGCITGNVQSPLRPGRGQHYNNMLIHADALQAVFCMKALISWILQCWEST